MSALQNGIIISEPFDGYCLSTLVDGVVSYSGGLNWEEYKALKKTNSNLDIKLITDEEFDLLLTDHNRKKYLNQSPKKINEERYNDMLEVLPPEHWCVEYGVNQFRMCEYQTGSITTQFGKYKGIFLEKFIDVNDRSTWLTTTDFEIFEEEPK